MYTALKEVNDKRHHWFHFDLNAKFNEEHKENAPGKKSK